MDVKLVWQTLGVALRSNIIRILTVHYYYITNLLDHILIARMEHVLFLYNPNRERSLLIFTIHETLVKIGSGFLPSSSSLQMVMENL
jgi:hypothetical protein